MPRLVEVYEHRWYVPGEEPPAEDHKVLVEGIDERSARAAVIEQRRTLKNSTLFGPGSKQRYEQYFEKYGPTAERTVCRRVRVAGDEAT